MSGGECLVDYKGPNGDRLLIKREEGGVPVPGKMEITVFFDTEFRPFVVNRRWFYSLARAVMTRRGFRRWRGRMKQRGRA